MIQGYCEDHTEPCELTASPEVQRGSDLLRHRDVWQPGLNVLNSKGTEKTMVDDVALMIFFSFFFRLQVSLREVLILG